VSSRGSVLRGPAGQAPLPGFDTGRDDASAGAQGQEVWASHVRNALAARSAQALDMAEESLCAFPADPELLLLAALTNALVKQMLAARASRADVYAMSATPVTSAQVWKAWVRAARYWLAGRR